MIKPQVVHIDITPLKYDFLTGFGKIIQVQNENPGANTNLCTFLEPYPETRYGI